MKRKFLAIILISISIASSSQTKQIELANVKTKEDAENLISANPNTDGKVFHIGFGTDAAEIFSQLYTKDPGFTFRVDNYTYKLIEFDSTLNFRVSYIYLDGSKLEKNEINHLRQLIISKYKSGISFTELASQYNMDGNTTGDTNWFGENVMAKEFEAAVKLHKKGEIFTVDAPALNWYHVVLKTHDATYKKNFTLLKIKSSR